MVIQCCFICCSGCCTGCFNSFFAANCKKTHPYQSCIHYQIHLCRSHEHCSRLNSNEGGRLTELKRSPVLPQPLLHLSIYSSRAHLTVFSTQSYYGSEWACSSGWDTTTNRKLYMCIHLSPLTSSIIRSIECPLQRGSRQLVWQRQCECGLEWHRLAYLVWTDGSMYNCHVDLLFVGDQLPFGKREQQHSLPENPFLIFHPLLSPLEMIHTYHNGR